MTLHLEGQKFGRLTVIQRAAEKDKRGRCWLWVCKCDCGNTCLISGPLLIKGRTRSCGCLSRELHKKDITGQRFGHLTAIRPTTETSRRGIVWLWKCDCGNNIESTIDAVKYGGRRSCGCRNLAVKKRQAIEMQEGCGRQDGTALCLLKSDAPQKSNTSGYRGVTWHRAKQKWVARIQFRGKTHHLGYFDSPEEASAAYQAAKKQIHGEYIKEQEQKDGDGHNNIS